MVACRRETAPKHGKHSAEGLKAFSQRPEWIASVQIGKQNQLNRRPTVDAASDEARPCVGAALGAQTLAWGSDMSILSRWVIHQ